MKTVQLKKILVPIDFSSVSLAAFDHAVFLARLFKADLTAIHVVDIPQTIYTIENPMTPGIDVSKVESDIAARFEDLADDTRKEYGIRMKYVITRGRIAKEIVSFVEENKIDLVVMGTHGLSGLDEYFIGSNAHKVVTVCPRPVITVQRPAKKAGFNNILVPIDNSMHSREKLNYVMLLAKKFGSVIHILGLQEDDDALHKKQFSIKIKSIEQVIRKAGLAFKTKIIQGDDIALLSLKYGQRIKADLIAIMADNESRYGIFFGPFAKQIVNHSKIPVLSIKPSEGYFESVKPY